MFGQGILWTHSDVLSYTRHFAKRIHILLVELLHLGWNQLTGTIPYQLCALTELEVLILYTNKLVGDIPYEFGDLKSLVQFQLQMNKLGGTMPTAVCHLRDVQLVDLTVDCELECDCCSRCG
mmetsp:Transcript_6321/g.11251  ORF Transcript_6321/g.11251 Transcript_6321/m.11251 type:complete len:122 (-) Transcript_6321:678-1043(-)